MNHKSLLKIILFSTATLALNLTFIPASNATEMEGKTKVNHEFDTEDKMWSEIQGDFDSCQTLRDEATTIAAQKTDSQSDSTVATTQLNNLPAANRLTNNTPQLCQ